MTKNRLFQTWTCDNNHDARLVDGIFIECYVLVHWLIFGILQVLFVYRTIIVILDLKSFILHEGRKYAI